MKVVPFPKSVDPHDQQAFAAELEAALHGESGGEAADYWRELRADVRSLAPPMSPQFERELRERLDGRAAESSRVAAKRVGARSVLARAHAWLGSGQRPRLIALAGICATAAIVTVALAAPWQGTSPQVAEELSKPAARGQDSSSSAAGASSSGAVATQSAPLNRPAPKTATSAEPVKEASSNSVSAAVSAAGESSTARVQQRAASITLAAKPEGVQSVADQVAQLAARDGGFVQSSQVHLQQGAGGEASLQLSLPSARLSAALAELARLASTRAESQSLQDITDEYGAARRQLADAVAGRQALLRALSKASTQGEIESLRARLSLAGGAIARARSTLQSVSKRGSSSMVEVTVLGEAHASGSDSTLSKALHDAGDVLKVALAVMIVVLAVLVPLAVLVALLTLGLRASRRRLRERALS
jgi:hypothetical protein